jgi:hypothetical protein
MGHQYTTRNFRFIFFRGPKDFEKFIKDNDLSEDPNAAALLKAAKIIQARAAQQKASRAQRRVRQQNKAALLKTQKPKTNHKTKKDAFIHDNETKGKKSFEKD